MEALHTLMAPQTEQARNQLVHGLVTAKVRARQDDGTYVLDYLTMGSDEPSAPARVMMPMAGGQRGTYFFPEAGDEVVVAFELGDTNLPVILGAVWNQNDKPPDQAQPSSQNNIRTIVSRSGHELTFDDSTGTERVLIKTQGGHQLLMDDTPPGNVTLQASSGVTLSLDGTGQASITSATGTTSLTLSDTGVMLSTPTGMISLTDVAMLLSMSAGTIAITAPNMPINILTNGTPYPLGSLVTIT
jgi:phage baseplate assembly protein gpV